MKVYILVLLIILTSCNSISEKDLRQKIIGTWKGELINDQEEEPLEYITVDFTSSGKMTRFVEEGDSTYKSTYSIAGGYRIKGNTIYSQNVFLSTENKIKYSFKEDSLFLEFEGQKMKLIKIK